MGEPPNNADTARDQRFRLGDLLLNVGRREVSRSGKRLSLPGLSFDLLLVLSRKAPDTVSVDTLMDEVWTGKVVNPDTVTKRVEMVREALGDDSQNPRYIALVRGHGYRLLVPCKPVPARAGPGRWLGKWSLAVLGVLAMAAVITFAFMPSSESPPTRVASPDRPSVAVLPFANRSANDADSFFVDGVHDDLLTRLSRIGSVKIISRTSVLQYRGTTKTIPQIGRELGVGHILEGGVQRAGEQVRVNVQLIDAGTDEHVWAETFDRQLTAANVFDIQSEIAEKVAAALASALTDEERIRLSVPPTTDIAALEAYFLGRQNMETRDGDRLLAAKENFETAIGHDPEFALGYIGLADTYRLIYNYTDSITREEFESQSLAAATRALTLDPELGEAHTSLANVLRSQGDDAMAEKAFLTALSLNPNYAPAYQWYGEFLAGQGRFDEGIEAARQAVVLNPRSPILFADLGKTMHFAGRLEEAMTHYAQALELDPGFAVAHWQLGIAQYQGGQLNQAVIHLREAIALDNQDQAILGLVYMDLLDFDQAGYWIEQMLELSPEHGLATGAMSWLQIALGQQGSAVEYAHRALEARPGWWRPLLVLRDHYLKTGQVQKARQIYQAAYPSLLTADARVDHDNYLAAIDLALVLQRNGEQIQASSLLQQCAEFIKTLPRFGPLGYTMIDAQVFALMGEPEKALDALEQAIDEGWRTSWWYLLRHDMTLQSIRDLPRFGTLVAEIEADVARQRSSLSALESAAGNP
ncbi:MAG: tetratricopeptide repeat protein [Xanthomonadales bacterium]|nr:tetratricopeptide repeat protein [Xanthomonadales bacterium]